MYVIATPNNKIPGVVVFLDGLVHLAADLVAVSLQVIERVLDRLVDRLLDVATHLVDLVHATDSLLEGGKCYSISM